MQSIEISDDSYIKLMRYCNESGESISDALTRAANILTEIDKIDSEYMQSQPVLSHEEVCKRYGLI